LHRGVEGVGISIGRKTYQKNGRDIGCSLPSSSSHFREKVKAILQVPLDPRQGRIPSGSSFPKVAKLIFSKYDGTEDPTTWVCRAEQFFDFQNIVEEER